MTEVVYMPSGAPGLLPVSPSPIGVYTMRVPAYDKTTSSELCDQLTDLLPAGSTVLLMEPGYELSAMTEEELRQVAEGAGFELVKDGGIARSGLVLLSALLRSLGGEAHIPRNLLDEVERDDRICRWDDPLGDCMRLQLMRPGEDLPIPPLEPASACGDGEP